MRLLTHLNIDDEIFASVKVDYDSPHTGRREKVDLKNQNILKSIIMEGETATGYEYILAEMELKYITDNRPGSRAYLCYQEELEHSELPEITPHEHPVVTEAGA